MGKKSIMLKGLFNHQNMRFKQICIDNGHLNFHISFSLGELLTKLPGIKEIVERSKGEHGVILKIKKIFIPLAPMFETQ